MRFIFFYLRESFVPQVKEKTSTRSMLHALDKGLADFDLSSQPRVRMAEAIVLTKHGPAMSLASSYSPLVEFILIYLCLLFLSTKIVQPQFYLHCLPWFNVLSRRVSQKSGLLRIVNIGGFAGGTSLC